MHCTVFLFEKCYLWISRMHCCFLWKTHDLVDLFLKFHIWTLCAYISLRTFLFRFWKQWNNSVTFHFIKLGATIKIPSEVKICWNCCFSFSDLHMLNGHDLVGHLMPVQAGGRSGGENIFWDAGNMSKLLH